MPPALLALAIGAFGIGTTEFVIMGLLPEVARDYGVPIPTAGLLVTGSATWLLALFGLGVIGGNLLGGRYADRRLMPMLYVTLGGLAVVLDLFTVTDHSKAMAAVTIALVGALGFATVPPLQKRVLDQASDAPTLASAVNIGAFKLGNALAAWLGGAVIAAGLGHRLGTAAGRRRNADRDRAVVHDRNHAMCTTATARRPGAADPRPPAHLPRGTPRDFRDKDKRAVDRAPY